MKLLTHPLYLAPVPLYAQLFAADTLVVDTFSPFVKQTFRNRAIITTENEIGRASGRERVFV